MRRLIKIVVILALCLAVYVGLQELNKPSVGNIRQPSNKTQNNSVGVELRSLTSKYAKFKYPAVFQTLKADPPVAPNIAVHDFSKPGVTSSWHLTVQIRQLANGSLEDDGTYHMRQLNPERFSRVESQSAVIFTDNASDSGFSQTGFLQKGALGAAVTVSGNSGESKELQEALETVLSSWQWL